MIFVFGSVNVDLVARVRTIPRPGETVLAPGYDRFFGGKGANQAVAAARMADGGPCCVFFCGAVGNDGFAEDCVANLRGEAVDVSQVQRVGLSTGCAFIAVEEAGENAITVASGANRLVRADRVGDGFLSAVDVLVLQMEVSWEENATLAARAKAAGATVILNFAPAPRDLDPVDIGRLLAAVDMLVINEEEGRDLAHALGLSGDEIDDQLARRLMLSVITTLGAQGTRLTQFGMSTWRCPAVEVEVIDTTGAGDTFVGVLANGIDEGRPIREAVQRASLAASLACTKAGAQAGAPKREALERYAGQSPFGDERDATKSLEAGELRSPPL